VKTLRETRPADVATTRAAIAARLNAMGYPVESAALAGR
jgi:hypothetical protein